MKFIGITGGVGAGKSELLSYLRKKEKTKVMLADEIAHELMEPGTECYEAICSRFPQKELLNEDGTFHRIKMAEIIFQNPDNRKAMNDIVHPAVKEYVIREYHRQMDAGELDYLFLEAALLIEEHYDEICDELWYIYTSEDNRRARLKASRGYSDEKIDAIFTSQLSEEEFRSKCRITIDNNGSVEQLYTQIEEGLKNG